MSRAIGTTACPRCRDRGADSRGDNLVEYADGGAHCFACGYHRPSRRFVPKLIEKDYHEQTSLPADFTREVPGIAWKWLLQYGLPMSYWRPYVGFSPKDSRLVFTCGDPAFFSIGRYIEHEGNSEVRQREGSTLHGVAASRAARKWFVWGDSHKHAICYGDQDAGTTVALVEDVISAHKVGRLAIAIPLFGTVVHPCHIQLCKHIGLPIKLWLDKDQQGTTYKKAAHISMYTGLPVEVVHTDKDPKELDLETIKGTLNV